MTDIWFLRGGCRSPLPPRHQISTHQQNLVLEKHGWCLAGTGVRVVKDEGWYLENMGLMF